MKAKESMMIYTVLGIFESISQTENVLLAAQAAGFSLQRISCILHYPETLSQKESLNTTLDALLQLYRITIPDVGTVLIGGPFIASFGLTGTSRATIRDAATGLTAGGITGALIGLGISKTHALNLQQYLQEGNILIGLPATNEQIPFIKKLFGEHHVLESVVMRTPTHQYPYLLSSLLFQYEYPAKSSFAYVGVKGGKKNKP